MLYSILFKSDYLLFSKKSVPLQCVFHSIRFKVNKGWSKALLLFLCLYVTFYIFIWKIYNKAVSLQQNRKTNDEPNITITQHFSNSCRDILFLQFKLRTCTLVQRIHLNSPILFYRNCLSNSFYL